MIGQSAFIRPNGTKRRVLEGYSNELEGSQDQGLPARRSRRRCPRAAHGPGPGGGGRVASSRRRSALTAADATIAEGRRCASTARAEGRRSACTAAGRRRNVCNECRRPDKERAALSARRLGIARLSQPRVVHSANALTCPASGRTLDITLRTCSTHGAYRCSRMSELGSLRTRGS